MRYGSILVVADGREGTQAVARTAMDLGTAFQCHVEWLHVRQGTAEGRTIAAGSMGPAAVWEPLVLGDDGESDARAERARSLFKQLCEDPGLAIDVKETPPCDRLTASFRELEGFEPDLVESEGRLVSGSSASLHAAILGTGRPVLVLAPQGRSAMPTTAAIAWDGSKQAARAVTAALPLLLRADKVVVITGLVNEDVSNPSRLVRYLSGHGVEARTWAFVPQEGSLGRDILGQSTEAEAELLVMGAYSRGRLRELVLGGVTRECLRHGEIPMLVNH
jgi:nucleotide-binding universal stress UspA family protein